MISTDMSMDTIMEDDESFASNANATIYGASERTESLISDLNILNSSSASEDDYHQQQISTATGDSSDDLIVSSCASSNLFMNNNKLGVVRLFNVVIGALSSNTQSQNQFAQAENSSFRMWVSDSYSNLPARNQRQIILKKSITLLRKLWEVIKSEQIRSPIIWPRMRQESPPIVGFRKIDPERWEFANKAFLKGNKHLLRNDSQPLPLPPTELGRFGLDEEVDQLRRDKQVLMAEIVMKLRHNTRAYPFVHHESEIMDPSNHQPSSSSSQNIWTSVLNTRFVHAVDLLGGHERLILNQYWSLWMSKISNLFTSKIICRAFDASIGDIDPLYRTCIVQCEKTGCAGEICLPHCKYSLDGSLLNSQKEPLYMQLNQTDCPSDCKYHCMLQREKKRASLGFRPVKYHGKWPLKRVLGLQEPLPVAFSALNLAKNVQGCLSFFNLNKRKPYNYAALWHIYGLLSVNSCVWSVIFHSRGMEITEKLNCISAVALLGFSLIISILRSFNIKDEATRVLVAAPLFAFTITHILYLNNYQMDYGWNTKVCVTMGVVQLLIWAIWARISHHPSKSKIWTVVFGSGLAMFLENYDFPPYAGLIDAHALWHAIAILLTCIWWSFIQDDAKYQAFDFSKKEK